MRPQFTVAHLTAERGGVVIMGKGDQRSKRGKIHRGTFGKSRPKKKKNKSNEKK
jgi:30S ribosomal protein S31